MHQKCFVITKPNACKVLGQHGFVITKPSSDSDIQPFRIYETEELHINHSLQCKRNLHGSPTGERDHQLPNPIGGSSNTCLGTMTSPFGTCGGRLRVSPCNSSFPGVVTLLSAMCAFPLGRVFFVTTTLACHELSSQRNVLVIRSSDMCGGVRLRCVISQAGQ